MVEITKGIPEHRQAEHSDVIAQRARVIGAEEAVVTTSARSPMRTNGRSDWNTFACTHIDDRSAMVYVGVVPACSS